MVISSLVIETLPDFTESAAEALAAMEGVEVHETNEYKLVVTIEAESTDASHAIASSFIQVEGVIGVNLIYFNFEDEVL